MNEDYNFYKAYHTHPVNKAIHLFCIPLIIFCLFNYIFYISQRYLRYYNIGTVHIFCSLLLFYTIYYSIYMNIYVACWMFVYFCNIYCFSNIFIILNKKWLKYTHYLFVFAWVMQFVGHYIEGNRPALTDSLSQALLGAPVFSLYDIYPNIINGL